MKKGWPTKTLSEVCEVFADGDWVESKDQSSEGIRLIQTGNVGEGVFKDRAEKARYISEATFRRLRCTEIVEGDCLVSRLPDPVGRSCILPDTGERMITAVDCTILRFNPKQLLPTFFNLYSQSDDYLTTVAKECTGTTRNRISRSNLGLTPIPVPPLAEQQRIVGLLDEAFEGLATAKANAEKNLQNARALFESHLQSVFTQRSPGWVEKPLGDLCDFLNGFAFKSGDAVAESQTQLVRMGNLYGNNLDLGRSPVFYPDSFANEHSRYVLEEGDIIMSLTGTTGKEDYGFAVRIPDCGHTLLMNQRIMKFDAIRRDIIDDGYLLHYLRSRCFLDFLYPTANGTRQANLSSVTMKALPVPLRPLTEQKAIATNLDALSEETQRLARLYERKHAALEALKKSLLHQAFTGEL
jgi:type I restriction enzyme S subunit